MLMLLFHIGKERYALDCDKIIEVLPKVRLKKIPQAPDYAAGLLNYGGDPVPVIDACSLLENRPSNSALHTRIILFNPSNEIGETNLLGVIGEQVTETVDLDKSDFIESGFKIRKLPYLGGIYSDDDQTIQFFNIDELYNSLKGILID